MAKRKVQPLIQAMNLFDSLDERDQATLADWIRSQMRPREKTAPKSPASPVVRRSSKRLEGTNSTVSTATDKGNAGIALPDDPDQFKHGAAA